jgi:hypothetical protein
LLGPSILFFSPPFCTGYAFHAYRFARARRVALAGLVLAGCELGILIALMVYSTIANTVS